jgi:endoglucanase
MRSLAIGARAAVLVVAVTTALACASGAADNLVDESDADAGPSDAGATTPTTFDSGAARPPGEDSGEANDTGYAYESDTGSNIGNDAAYEDDVSTIFADVSTGGPPADSSPAPPDAAEAAAPPPQTGLSVLYQVQDSATTSAYIGCELSITNAGTGSPALSDLKARYYYTDEVHQTPQITVNWSHVSTSGADQDLGVTFSVVSLTPAVTNADTYVEFSFSSNGSPALTAGESAQFSWQLQGPNPAQDIYTQTNDYSFNAADTTLTSSENIVLLQSGVVVWGVEP